MAAIAIILFSRFLDRRNDTVFCVVPADVCGKLFSSMPIEIIIPNQSLHPLFESLTTTDKPRPLFTPYHTSISNAVYVLTFSVMTKIYATLGRKFNKEDLEKAMQANQQLEDDPALPKSYTCKSLFERLQLIQ